MAAQQQHQPARQGPPPAPPGVQRIEAMLTGMTKDFEAALPAAAKARVGDFLRMALIDIPRSRQMIELAEKNPSRILIALMDIARLGLFPGSKLGEAYIVPFAVGKGNERRPDCSAIVGYQGFLKLARNSGLIESVSARAVFEGDLFEVRYGLHEDIVHIPNREIDRSDPGLLRGVYSIARFKGGGMHIDWMSDLEVLAIAKRSKTYNPYEGTWSGPWETDWIQMAIKTVIRRAAKQWPKSVELAEAVALDEADIITVRPEETVVSRPALENTARTIFQIPPDEEPAYEPAAQREATPAQRAFAPPPDEQAQAPRETATSKPRARRAPQEAPPREAAGPGPGPAPVAAQLTEAEKVEIIRREREEAEREAMARDRARGD